MGEYPQLLLWRFHLTLSPFSIVPRWNPSSGSASGSILEPVLLDSPPSSPKRNAAFSLLGPVVGRLPDFKNGDEGFGGDGFEEELEWVSGSNIQLKELQNR